MNALHAESLGYVQLSTLPKGSYIKRKESASAVYIKGAYDRGSKSFSCQDVDDMNREVFIKGGKLVFAGFAY